MLPPKSRDLVEVSNGTWMHIVVGVVDMLARSTFIQKSAKMVVEKM
jgi:hypothetical protein